LNEYLNFSARSYCSTNFLLLY